MRWSGWLGGNRAKPFVVSLSNHMQQQSKSFHALRARVTFCFGRK